MTSGIDLSLEEKNKLENKNSLNKDIENESKIRYLRKTRKFPKNEDNFQYLKERKIVGIKYVVKDPDDINWKKKNINFKEYPGYDILLCLAKQYSYESLINAIIKNNNGKNNNNKLKNIVSGLIEANGYANIISMLLQIKYRLNEKKQIEDEKDINNDDSSSSDSEGNTYLKIKSFKNNKKEVQPNILSSNQVKAKDNTMNNPLNENQQSNQDQLDSKNIRAKRRNFIW